MKEPHSAAQVFFLKGGAGRVEGGCRPAAGSPGELGSGLQGPRQATGNRSSVCPVRGAGALAPGVYAAVLASGHPEGHLAL